MQELMNLLPANLDPTSVGFDASMIAATNQMTKFGAFLDSTIDRYNDVVRTVAGSTPSMKVVDYAAYAATWPSPCRNAAM